jgi:TolA-binding protein
MISLGQSNKAMWPLVGLARLKYKLNDDTAAQTFVDRLKSDFGANPELPEALYTIARSCKKFRKSLKANNLYQHIIQTWPGSSFAVRSKIDRSVMNIASLIEAGQDSQAQSSYNTLLATYGSHPNADNAVFCVGEAFYNRAKQRESEGKPNEASSDFSKAAVIWEKILADYPNVSRVDQVCCWLGDIYFRQGKYADSQRCFQQVVNDHSEYKYVWHAYFMAGRNFEKMNTSGLISEAEALPLIRAAYEEVVNKYPTCQWAGYAQNWITNNNTK